MNKQSSKRAGRPPHAPTPETRGIVKRLAAQGNARGEIAMAMGITEPTLRKHYYVELREGFTLGKIANTKRLNEQAAKGNVTAMIWLDKTRYGITDPTQASIGKKAEVAERARVVDNGTQWAGLLN